MLHCNLNLAKIVNMKTIYRSKRTVPILLIKVFSYGFFIMEIRIIYFCVAELFITQRMCNKDVIGAFCSKYFLITSASRPMCMSAGIFNNNMLASQYGPTSKFTILNIVALCPKFASF